MRARGISPQTAVDVVWRHTGKGDDVTIQTQERSSDPVGSELPTSIGAGTEGEEAGLTLSLPRPIFVIGSLRSGASILWSSLGQHPNIAPILDTAWVERFAIGLEQAYAEDA